MPGIDETLLFHPLSIAVLTISDTRDETTDKSGARLQSSARPRRSSLKAA